MPPHFNLLYKIACNRKDTSNHPMPAFRDTPVPDLPENSGHQSLPPDLHLNGTLPVYDLGTFMENDSDDIAFVVIRTVECSEASVLIARTGGSLRWTEDVYMKSNTSKYAMQQIATCYFQRFPQPKKVPFAPNLIVPADLFLYHHRHLLRTFASEHSEAKEHINGLLEYMGDRFGREFAEADSLLAQGQISQAHILTLFKPNSIVVSGTYGKPAAFVLQEWPTLSSDGWVTLLCWSFQPDGAGFARKRTSLSIPPIGPKPLKIQNLVAYPLEFALPELQELIRSRGKKQWELRTTTQVSYKGWNVGQDRFYVSPRHVYLFAHFADTSSTMPDS